MRCYGCMNEYSDEYEICPFCGYIKESKPEEALQIEPGSMLSNRYLIGKSIGCGGFGVTYIGWDTQLNRKIAVKEYLPSEFATRVPGQTTVTVFSGDKTEQFNDGLDKFIDEARRLAKFKSEKGIVTIYDSFEENNTAYIIMEYLDGETLAQYLDREGKLPAEQAVSMLMPLMESLAAVHETGIIHRDIAPDNIFITNKGDVKLIDFGAARYATTSHSRSLSVIVKPGYSPEEQYRSRGDQGPHTDVYALGGVLYKMLTGIAPPDAMERRAQFEGKNKDILEPVSKYTQNISANQETAIMNALNVRIEDRTPDVISLVGELISDEPVARRAGKIKKIDVLKWPLWLKIAAPTALVTACTLLVLLLTGVIHFSTPDTEIDLDGLVRVPSVVNMAFDDAQKMLDKKGNLLNISIGGGEYSNDIDENKIYFQDPDAASKVLPGTEIKATISYGPESSFMIDVMGYSKKLAQQSLEELGFVVEFEEKESNDAPGSVIGQSIKDGEKLAIGETVTLTISTGNSNVDTSVSVTVPNIIGKNIENAKSVLSPHYLSPMVDNSIYSNRPEGEILEQYPAAGVEAHQGDIIYVVTSLGIKKQIMPRVTGKPLDAAIDELRNNGLEYSGSKEEENDIYSEGCVIRAVNASGNTIIEGSEITDGAKVTLVISKTSKVTVPDVVGSTESSAISALSGNFLIDIQHKQSADVPKGKVISQSPSANQKVSKQSVVTIYISEGKNEEQEPTTKKVTLSSIKVTKKPNKTEYWIGDSFDKTGMEVTAYYSDKSNKSITNFSVEVETNTAGTFPIKVVYSDMSDRSTTITVKEPHIELSSTDVAVEKGKSITITAKTYPDGYNVTWDTESKSIATVSGGKISGISSGNTNVIASFSYKSKQYNKKCYVKVSQASAPVETNQCTVTLDANGGEFSSGLARSSETIKVGSTVTFPTPQKPKAVTLSYNANGGSNSPSSQIIGLSFKGWATSKTATSGNTTYKPMSNNPVTLYAIWGESQTNISNSQPTRTDYKFLGWSKIQSATSVSYSAGDQISITESTTIYAVWEETIKTFVIDIVNPSNRTTSTSYTYLKVNNGESIDIKLNIILPDYGKNKYTLWFGVQYYSVEEGVHWVEPRNYYVNGTTTFTYTINTNELNLEPGEYYYSFAIFDSNNFVTGAKLGEDVFGHILIK